MNSISIVITTFNDQYYLEKLLLDIKRQDYPGYKIEIIIIEAGKNYTENVLNLFSESDINIKYFYRANLNRNASLNLAFSIAINSLIVRLDARTHIENNYLILLGSLENKIQCSNVGGIKVPIGETKKQKFIARLMQNPFCLGGAKFRKKDYEGYADTVYLGCFSRKKISGKFYFDEKFIRISEDADLNYQLIKAGEKIYISSKIKAYYYCRETFLSFFKLIFNYGVSRGLFIMKNKTYTSLRQVVLPIGASFICILLCLALINKTFLFILIFLISFYFLLLFLISFLYEKKNIYNIIKLFFSLFFTHLSWTLGFFYSLKLLYDYSKKNV